MDRPSLSVIVPVFNMEKYLRTCIDSLLEQTYKDMQIIFVNDCSTDNSLSILRNYERCNPDKVKVIDSKRNLRQGGARNLGMNASESEYIGFVDADDFINSNMYEILMRTARKNDSDVVYCRFEEVNEKDTLKSVSERLYGIDDIKDEPSHRQMSDEERMVLMASHEYGSVWGGGYIVVI